jgi:Meiotically up-regulated gene 113
MSIGTLPVFTKEGRLAGCFVYLLVCQDGDPIYVKIGITIQPDHRLRALVNNCPVKAQRFATIRLWSRRKALDIENKLHSTFKQNRVTGEWFKFTLDEKQAFNAELRKILAEHSLPNWPLVIDQMPVKPFMDRAKARQRYFRRQMRRRGRAFQDFQKDLRG